MTDHTDGLGHTRGTSWLVEWRDDAADVFEDGDD
jgi:hypothetical protein